MSNYEVDLKANAILMIIMQQDLNVLSPYVYISYYDLIRRIRILYARFVIMVNQRNVVNLDLPFMVHLRK